MSLELDLCEKIRTWLRYHSTYHVSIELYELYQCFWIKVMDHSTVIKFLHGMTLSKQLQQTLDFLHGIDSSDYADPNKPIPYAREIKSHGRKDLAKSLFLAYNKDNKAELMDFAISGKVPPEWEYVAEEAFRIFSEIEA